MILKKPQSTSEWFVLVVGSAFGLGLLPIAPGSFGALLGIMLHALIVPLSPLAPWLTLILLMLAVSVTHYALARAAAIYWNDSDSGNFVLDEVAGYLLTAAILAPWLPTPWIMIEGFLLFRVLDIIKPPPARQIDEKMHTATGVLLDDLVSAVYAGIIILAQYFILGWPAN